MLLPHESNGALDCFLYDLHTESDDQFSSFLETLALPENSIGVSELLDSTSLAAPEGAYYASKGRSSDARDVSSSQWSCVASQKARSLSAEHGMCALDREGIDTELQLINLPTAQVIKKEKLRAKNRRNQKAYRDRMRVQEKELQEVVTQKKEQLQAGRERWRHLRMERQTIQHRTVPPPPADPEPSQSCMQSEASIAEASVKACNAEEQVSQSTPSSNIQFRADVAKLCAEEMVLLAQKGIQRPANPLQGAMPSQRPISSFKHHASISFAAVSKYMTPQEFRSSCQFNFQELRHAIKDYQHQIAKSLQVPSSDICWFLEWPYATVSPALSVSSSVVSPECRLSATTAHIATAMECLFLIMEYEHLASTSIPSFKPPVHPTLDASAPPPATPTPPDQAVLAAAYMRCGVNQRMHAEAAVRGILQPVLQRYKGLLPREKWLAVCMQSMRVGQAVVDVLRAVPEQPQLVQSATNSNEGAENCSAKQGMHPSTLISATIAAHQLGLCIVDEAMRQTPSKAQHREIPTVLPMTVQEVNASSR